MATEIVLDGYGKLNIKEGTNLPLNFNIQNLTKPESTPSSYSKDVVIIGDKNSNKILGQAFDVNISDSSFDINKKVGCDVLQDNASVFDGGFFQLLKVTKTGQSLPNGEPKIEYVGRVKSDLMNFFTSIKDKDLTDIKLGGFDTYELLNRDNILASFSNDVTDKWKYVPLYKATNTNRFRVKHWRPGIYAKVYWDEIHKQNGWQYEFGELEDVNFDKLIIPYTGEFDADETTKDYSTYIGDNKTFQQADMGCHTYRIQPGEVFINNLISSEAVNNDLRITDDIRDNFNQYNTSSNVFEANFNSKYNIKYTFNAELFLNNPNSYNIVLQNTTTNTRLQIYLIYKYTIVRADGTIENEFGSKIPGSTAELPGTHPPILNQGNNSIYNRNITFDFDVNLNQGDKITNVSILEADTITTNLTNTIVYWGKSGVIRPDFEAVCSIFNIYSTDLTVTPDLGYDIGTPIYLEQFIPRKVKQRDFIKSIIDMYKLVVDIDPQNDNKLIYKTRDKYYDEGGEIDWTDKLNKDKPINLEWLVNKQPKKLKFTYTQDEGEFNKAYFNHIKDVYGEFEYDYLNDYNVGTNELKLIFSPTPIQYDEESNMYLPSLPLTSIDDLNIRILYDGGIRTGNWFMENDDSTFPLDNETDYPYFGHLDDPETPSFDLNWAPCEFYFYNTWQFTTNNNLFNLYHRRYINQLTKGRIMTAHFNLTPLDITNLKLNSRIFINDAWWNINRVIDYNANSNSTTKVELVTVDDGVSITPSVPIIPPLRPNPTKPYVYNPNAKYGENELIAVNTISKGFVGRVYGEGNTVSRTARGVVVGDNNIMGGQSIVVGTKSSDNGLGGKLIVGDNKTADANYDAFIGETKIGESINIKETEYTNVGMVYDSAYVEGEYVVDGYFETIDANVTFGYASGATGSSIVNIQGDTAEFNVTNVNMTNVTNVDMSNITMTGPITLDYIGTTTPVNNLGVDINGNIVIGSTGGGGSMTLTPITYSNLKTLKDNNNLTTGTRYYITDREIWIDALDTDKLAMECKRHFKVIRDQYYTPYTDSSGLFNDNYLGIYGQGMQKGTVPNSGSDRYFAIWGGRMWQRDTSGSDVPGTSNTTIAGGWILQTSSTYYESKIFSIKYNFDDDIIWEQSDDRGNIVRRENSGTTYIDNTDWGNSLIYNNTSTGIFNNYADSTTKATIYENNITRAIYNNIVGVSIYANILLGEISNNEVTDYIHNNTNLGSIYGNDLDTIMDNSNSGNINDNLRGFTGADITYNSNKGHINENKANVISNNSNSGDIYYNYIGYVQRNLNNGRINENSTNNYTSGISDNINNGYVVRNVINGAYAVFKNANNGNIGNPSTYTTRNGNVTDSQVNK